MNSMLPPQTVHIVPHQQMQHQIPGPHMRHHPEMYPPGMPAGYQSRRPSPPPFHPAAAHALSTPYLLPRSGSPSNTPPLPTRHLGTFVFPRVPFPFLDFPSEPGADPVDVRATLLLPARCLPLARPAQIGRAHV